jgi:hypothetical protein
MIKIRSIRSLYLGSQTFWSGCHSSNRIGCAEQVDPHSQNVVGIEMRIASKLI